MRIGILTSFTSMMDFYSLTSVVRTQLKMIKQAGHQPVMMAQEDFQWANAPEWCEVRRPIKSFTKKDYQSLKDVTPEHQALVPVIADGIWNAIQDLDAVLAHDLLFTGWHVPIGMAIHEVCKRKPELPWFHWVHSVPGGNRDYWRVPEGSFMVYPNHTDRVRCAENFKTWPERVIVIPHCCDLRDFGVRTDLADRIITRFDLLSADLVQVYPVPTDRIEAKGIHDVIRLFSCFKRLGKTVRLVVPNAWCNVDKWKNKISQLQEFARQQGLSTREVIFTSTVYPEHEVGLSLDVISDLARCANIFICPTQSETFGLSLAEAAMSGCLLVLNQDLPMMTEIAGNVGNAVWARFSSSFMKTEHQNPNAYLADIAKIVLHAFDNSPSLKSSTYYRQAYRREAVWRSLESAILAAKVAKQAANA